MKDCWTRISNYGPDLLFWSWKKSFKFMLIFFWLPGVILLFPVLAAFSSGLRFSFWEDLKDIAHYAFQFLVPTTCTFLIFCFTEKIFSYRRLMAFLSGTGVFYVYMSIPDGFHFHIFPILISTVYGGINAMLCLETYEVRKLKNAGKNPSLPVP